MLRPNRVTRCTVTDCGKRVHARGMCQAHYRRAMLYNGDPNGGRQIRRQPVHCTVPGCLRKCSAHDLCSAHALRWYRKGNALPRKPIRKRRTKAELSQPT